MADVKISRDVFDALYRIHVLGTPQPGDERMIHDEIDEKRTKLERRQWYRVMQDKKLDDDVREYARERYAELSGIPEDYQYPLGSLDPPEGK